MEGCEDLPWYVLDKDLERNILVVAQNHEHPKLLSQTVTCQDLHWVAGKAPDMPLTCTAKTRYRQADAVCVLDVLNEGVCQAVFEQPQWAVTPGQSIVFYQGDVCLGGGVII